MYLIEPGHLIGPILKQQVYCPQDEDFYSNVEHCRTGYIPIEVNFIAEQLYKYLNLRVLKYCECPQRPRPLRHCQGCLQLTGSGGSVGAIVAANYT